MVSSSSAMSRRPFVHAYVVHVCMLACGVCLLHVCVRGCRDQRLTMLSASVALHSTYSTTGSPAE